MIADNDDNDDDDDDNDDNDDDDNNDDDNDDNDHWHAWAHVYTWAGLLEDLNLAVTVCRPLKWLEKGLKERWSCQESNLGHLAYCASAP